MDDRVEDEIGVSGQVRDITLSTPEKIYDFKDLAHNDQGNSAALSSVPPGKRREAPRLCYSLSSLLTLDKSKE